MHPVLSKFFAWWSCSIVLLRTMETYLNDKSVSRPSNCYKCSLFAQSCHSVFWRDHCSSLSGHYAQFFWKIIMPSLSEWSLASSSSAWSFYLLSLSLCFFPPLLSFLSAFLPLCFLFLFISSSPLSLAPPLPQFFLSPSSTWNSVSCRSLCFLCLTLSYSSPLLSSARLLSLCSLFFMTSLLLPFSAWTASFHCALHVIPFIYLTSDNELTYLKTHCSDNVANIYGRIFWLPVVTSAGHLQSRPSKKLSPLCSAYFFFPNWKKIG